MLFPNFRGILLTQLYLSSSPDSLDRLPVLVRGGTILPMGPAQESLAYILDNHQFANLQQNLWPPYPAQGVLYDDDGCSRAYQRGEYALTRFIAEENGNCLDVHIAATEGSFPGQVGGRQIELVVYHCSQPQRVTMNRSLLTGWIYET
jgi:oligosaccharide 4-alpha-D-glucosyltransferase